MDTDKAARTNAELADDLERANAWFDNARRRDFRHGLLREAAAALRAAAPPDASPVAVTEAITADMRDAGAVALYKLEHDLDHEPVAIHADYLEKAWVVLGAALSAREKPRFESSHTVEYRGGSTSVQPGDALAREVGEQTDGREDGV